MSTPLPDTRQADRTRVRRALNASLGAVLLLAACFAAQQGFDYRFLTVTPWTPQGLTGLLTAPLLHGSVEHILANSIALLMLGTLAGTTYPKATLRALPLLWLGSGLGAWLLGQPNSHHLGASGVTHGLAFLVFTLGLLRRDRAAIAAGMLAFLFYGGMLLTILPREAGVSWESHLGGALGGVIAAFLFRRCDPQPPRQPYSWEIEEELAREQGDAERAMYEPDSPRDVPVLWQQTDDEERGKVLPFRRRE
ncbi:MAG: rhomboid family intramembrane serine protease [Thermomonas sp.]|uniref:rhomboid family intramembrane serine protease n=1 Tax=Thermomonas sp. TaxID=1971895 RepID=UPI0039E50D48